MSKALINGGRFKISEKFKDVTYGQLYMAFDKRDEDKVLVKIEPVLKTQSRLKQEYSLYRLFHNGPGIAGIRYFGREKDAYIMVTDFLNKDLQTWFEACGKIFSEKTVCMIGMQAIEIIKFIHNKGYIHRDIKPESFMSGFEENARKIFLQNFKTATPYLDIHKKHKKFGKAKHMIGTTRFASVNLHLGNELSRRDDMESLGYMACYFLKGSLPWQGIDAPSLRERYEKISQVKQATSLDVLCKDLPPAIHQYMKYVRGLKFEEKPDYEYCVKFFSTIMSKHEYENDGEFDWILLRRRNNDA